VGACSQDEDQDGFIDATCPGGDDCDDDPASCGAACYPGNPAPDGCNGYDQDCDGQTDEEGDSDCEDGQYCNGVETCDGGACVPAGDPCVGGPECADSCDEDGDTCFLPAGTPCSPDLNLCTDDACDGLGACAHPNNNAPCDDGLYCSSGDSCVDGACRGTAETCPGQLCSEASELCDDTLIIDDPIGDGSSFAFVFEYRGRMWLGPRSDGTGAVHMQPDGSSLGSADFSFFQDIVDNAHRNGSPAPYPSIGITGCNASTPECGPDDEDGRGIFCSGTIGGEQWLVVGGTRLDGDLDYVYMTRDDDQVLDFSYVDLSPTLGPQTRGISAMHVFAERLYLGFPDTGGARPYLVVVMQLPQQPGMDATGNGGADCDPLNHDICSLHARNLPEVGQPAPMSMIDSITDFNDRLYLANNGGVVRSTVNQPLDADSSSDHWTPATPGAADYSGLTSITTDKTADIEPADKAVPAMVSFGGRLFLARNTESGPQLWACSPEVVAGPDPATASDCDPGDWQLVAPNTSGNQRLTQFNNPNNTHIAMLEAGQNHLYVAFDNAVDGLVLFRTANPLASSAVNFEGQDGCTADLHPTGCAGMRGNGLGDISNSRVFSSALLSHEGNGYLYLVVGNGVDPVKLYLLVDSIRECLVDTTCDDADSCTVDFCFNGNCSAYNTCPGECSDDCAGGCPNNDCCVQDCPSGQCPPCEPGCSCDQTCTGTGTCSTDCNSDSTCHLYSNSNDDADLFCSDAACFLDCNSTGGCTLNCSGDSLCRMDCNSSDSCALNCPDTASCLLRCNSVGSCNLICDDPVACGTGVLACNHLCP
jgi:hypothetical protein